MTCGRCRREIRRTAVVQLKKEEHKEGAEASQGMLTRSMRRRWIGT